MDYRYRNYYLVTVDWCSYDMRMEYFRIAAPSLKIHSPYNHFKNSSKEYDGQYTKHLGYGGYWQMMLSCKREDSEALEYELRKAVRNDREYNSIYSVGSSFLKLDKSLCGQ